MQWCEAVVKTGTESRRLALEALVRVEGDGAWSNRVLPGVLSGSSLDARDRAFVVELVRGTLRWQLALDHLLERVVSRPLPSLDVPIRQALRLGAYQLVRAGVAAHAAVSSTVEAVGDHRARGLVNGALRALARLGPPWPFEDDPVLLSFPDWIRQEWSAAPELMRGLQEPSTTHVRIRPGLEAQAMELLPAGASVGTLVASVRRLDAGGDPGEAVRRGVVTVQDEASAAVGAAALPPVDGAPAVDLCAAPGGKATHLAEQRPATLVVAGDVVRSRARTVAQNAHRLSLPNVATIVNDARVPALGNLPYGTGLLLDAPCTGLGTLRRRPEIRHRVTRDEVTRLRDFQIELARAAAALVPPGGSLLYSVCTLTREETLDVADVLLSLLDEEDSGLPLRPHPAYGRGPGGFLLPHVHDTDGMYVLRTRRPG